MKIKKTIIILSVLMLFLLIAGVSANDINTIDEISTTNDVDENIESSTINPEVVEEDLNDNKKLEYSYEDNLSDEGEFVDVTDAYAYLNAFRTEDGVWQWNEDNTTKTVFNTNSTNQLKPLVRDTALEETAKTRAKEMALAGKMSHTRPDGTICWTAFPDGLWAQGENIAYTYTTSCEYVTEKWKETNDPYDGQGHRRNMLDSNFNSVGIAGYKLNGVIYWAQDFGKYSNPAQLTNIKPKEAINITNNTLNPEFKINLPTDATGTFKIWVDENEVDTNTLSDGKSNITIVDLSLGTHKVLLSYSGDDKYYTINQATTINVAQNQNPTNPEPSNDIGTFTELNNLIQNATENTVIKLDKDYVFDNITDSDFKGGINIPKNLTIDGQGHTINGDGEAKAFTIFANNIILKNIKFTNNTSFNGGAIYGDWQSCITIINSSFINNNARYGGAIYNMGLCIIINSSFINNTSFNGGAIFASGLTVEHSIFINNTARDGGGAIMGGNITVEHSIFINNTASYGGAIDFPNQYTGNIINSSFINNNAQYSGGAICFIESGYDGWGSSSVDRIYRILRLKQSSNIINSTFIDNYAGLLGGGINSMFRYQGYPGESLNHIYYHWENFEDCNVFNSKFINNTAKFRNGAICGGTTVNCSFENNSRQSINFIEVYINGWQNGYNNNVIPYGQKLWLSCDLDYSEDSCDSEDEELNYTILVDGLVVNSSVIKISFGRHEIYINGELKVGKHEITIIKWDGLKFEKTTKIITINVKKENSIISPIKSTKIIAKKKVTFKAKKKSKKYTITLKAGKNPVKKVKVYLKIGKKTFKATTNKNGKATFKIKLNKKGTYKSKITFKGSKIYKATTKKVTIKIK